MPQFNELISSSAFANFLKELQTRFFFICGGSLIFVVFYKDTLTFQNDKILENSTATSGLFVANILAFAFLFYLIFLIADFLFEAQKDSYLSHRKLMRKTIDSLTKREAGFILEILKTYSFSGGSVLSRRVEEKDLPKYENLMNPGFISIPVKYGDPSRPKAYGLTVDSTLLKYVLENPSILQNLRNRAK